MTEEPRLLGGRYQLGPVLGRGGMAEVRRARDLRLGRDVAVKQLRIDLASDPTFQARFRREAQAAAGLNHPNIVAVYDTGEEADPHSGVQVPYIVMELVEGHTLREILRTGRQIVPAKALEFTQGVLDALSYSHKAGIVHRDIKPANVMLTSTGQVKVMDFGIARAVADTSATMTQTAAVIGTAQYLSPEQARGETVDSRSDIYSAGCLLYELLVGRPPFQGDSPVSVAYQHVREAPVPPSHLDPEITPAMDAITLKALAKDPADRYQTAAAMRADIGRLLAGQAVAATVPVVAAVPLAVPASAGDATAVLQPAEHTATRAVEDEEPRRRWGLMAFLVALVLLAAGIGIYFMVNANRVETVAVPNVVNRLTADAEQVLTDAKLQPVEEQVNGADDETVGRVIAQSVAAETSVPVGTEVTITINVGPSKGTVPQGIIGMDVDDAKKLLEDNSFTNVQTAPSPTESSDDTANEVLSVDPGEGTKITLDTAITLYYATGKSKLPQVIGFTESAARSMLGNAGFSNVTVKYEESTQTAGTVISQSPDALTMVKRTAKITLTIATAPSPSATPTDSATPDPTDTATP
ncbi:MAG: Stk1 family PASTA domain-containing Ser/Thr kinase [Propionicimonas sp.]|uniref:Stk1 family PASTA domain-containing Ser/Thr kinase n=1 Tax=Propionicimonas sp. TaxID=1955623 RepID=UPI003D0B13BB